jgi:hypothetical protein
MLFYHRNNFENRFRKSILANIFSGIKTTKIIAINKKLIFVAGIQLYKAPLPTKPKKKKIVQLYYMPPNDLNDRLEFDFFLHYYFGQQEASKAIGPHMIQCKLPINPKMKAVYSILL